MTRQLRTRINSSGYRQFWDEEEQRWTFTHRRVVEKRLGGEIPPGQEVHHINGDKLDNRRRNLVPLEPEVHDRIHRADPDACFRCGRSGHWDSDCDEETTIAGRPIDDEDEWDDEEDEDDDWDDDDDDEEDWDDEDDDDDY